MKRNILLILIVIFVSLVFAFSASAQGLQMTQGEYAKKLVKQLKWERYLPTAPREPDYVSFLEQLGIEPLEGWKKDDPIDEKFVITITALLLEQEKTVVEMAQKNCDRNVQILNYAWDQAKEIEGKDVSLEQLLNNKDLFPYGAPKCPYDRPYHDKNNDGTVEYHTHRGRRFVPEPDSRYGGIDKIPDEEIEKFMEESQIEEEPEREAEPEIPGRKEPTDVEQYAPDIELLKK